MSTTYTDSFYEAEKGDSLRSARAVVPLIQELLAPKSVVDVGAGLGTWTSVFLERGVADVVAVDGDYVNPNQLLIPLDRFLCRDLTKPLDLARTFDLVVSLEVAEHLPEAASGGFVSTLTSLGDAVLFSAAIPNQGGTHHVNEQWPEYWIEKFALAGYVCRDPLRRLIWNNPEVGFWYAQNMLLFVKANRLDMLARIDSTNTTAGTSFALVHPRQFLAAQGQIEWMSGKMREMSARIELLKDPREHTPAAAFVFFY